MEEKNVFNTTSLTCTLDYQPQTDEAFKMDGRKHTHTQLATEQILVKLILGKGSGNLG